VLGIDPRRRTHRLRIVESERRRCCSLYYGALTVADKIRKESTGAALEAVHVLICGLLEKFSPDALAVESIFSALNVKTAASPGGGARSGATGASQHGVKVYSYAPRLIKATVAGYGNCR